MEFNQLGAEIYQHPKVTCSENPLVKESVPKTNLEEINDNERGREKGTFNYAICE